MYKVVFSLLLFSAVSFAQNFPLISPDAKSTTETKLIYVNDEIIKHWDGKKSNTVFADDLFLANSNRGYDLFDPAKQNALLNAVDKTLDAFQMLGMKGVGMAIQYPVLVNGFPNADKYLDFYKKVFQKIHSRGMMTAVGCQATFTDSVFGEARLAADVNNWYNKGLNGNLLNSQRYLAEKTQMQQTIIDELAPDYLTIEMEPSTQYVNLKKLINYDVNSFLSYINYFINHLNPRNVKLGAGAGTWDNIQYFDKVSSQTNCSFIDMHIYPSNSDYIVDKAFKVDSLAKKYNKELIIGEAWCYKETDSEINSSTDAVATSGEIYQRDFFDYYQPIDILFIKAIVNLSNLASVKITSFFWPTVLFGYLTYNPALHDTMTTKERQKVGQQFGYDNMMAMSPSATGLYLKKLINLQTGVEDKSGLNGNYIVLRQNYPNPFNPSTVISFEIPSRNFVELKIYDLLGREITSLVNEEKDAGRYSIRFSGNDLASGIYFYRLTAGNYSQTKKLILMK